MEEEDVESAHKLDKCAVDVLQGLVVRFESVHQLWLAVDESAW